MSKKVKFLCQKKLTVYSRLEAFNKDFSRGGKNLPPKYPYPALVRENTPNSGRTFFPNSVPLPSRENLFCLGRDFFLTVKNLVSCITEIRKFHLFSIGKSLIIKKNSLPELGKKPFAPLPKKSIMPMAGRQACFWTFLASINSFSGLI